MAVKPQPDGNGHGTTALRLTNLEKGQEERRAQINDIHGRINKEASDLLQRIATIDNEVRQIGKFTFEAFLKVLAPLVFVVASLWVLAISPQESKIKSLETRLDSSEKKLEERIFRVEQNAPNKDALAERLDRIINQIARVEKDMEAAHKKFLTRDEFDLRRDTTNKSLTELREQYLELRRSIGELFPANNMIQEMVDRIKRLEEIRLNHQRTEQKNSGPAS